MLGAPRSLMPERQSLCIPAYRFGFYGRALVRMVSSVFNLAPSLAPSTRDSYLIREPKQVKTCKPEEEHQQSTWEKNYKFCLVVKPRTVVERFDEVGASIGDLKYLAGGGVDLYLPAILRSHLDDAFVRANIKAINVGPSLYMSPLDATCNLQDSLERDAG